MIDFDPLLKDVHVIIKGAALAIAATCPFYITILYLFTESWQHEFFSICCSIGMSTISIVYQHTICLFLELALGKKKIKLDYLVMQAFFMTACALSILILSAFTWDIVEAIWMKILVYYFLIQIPLLIIVHLISKFLRKDDSRSNNNPPIQNKVD